MLPTHRQPDTYTFGEARRLWGSRRARLVSFAFAVFCILIVLSASSGPRLRLFPSPWSPSQDLDAEETPSSPPPPSLPEKPPLPLPRPLYWPRPPTNNPPLAAAPTPTRASNLPPPATVITDPPPFPKLPTPEDSGDLALWRQRAEQVKEAFVRSYEVYEEFAYPHDELRPVSDGIRDNFNGWGATLVDGFDTMILMGLDDLTNRSIAHIAKLTFVEVSNSPHLLHKNKQIQFFETVIRYLGGLLSAYALASQPLYLARADDLGRALIPIFNTTTGLPPFGINTKTGIGGIGWPGNSAILSEMASFQMEYRYLAHLTGRPEYVKHADFITEFLRQHEEHDGLLPLAYSLKNGEAQGKLYSVGARADSAYEYLLKQWLMTGRTEPKFLDMYLRSADAIIEYMLYISPQRKLLYATDLQRTTLRPIGDFQHLSCFLAGVFALGAATIPNVDPRHAWAAEGLAHTCWITYADAATGLGPEVIIFRGNAAGHRWVDELRSWDVRGRPGAVPGTSEATPVRGEEDREYEIHDKRYLLRPETIESFYILYRTTGAAKWRERGWAVFDAIERHTRTKNAYASIKDVNAVPAPRDDDMPSFFFAETLKYAYLLFAEEDKVPLERWTFNTEAHPFPTFTWSAWEQEHLGIR
ncbi:glycoside hydrolase family 47 protein [Phanerochaete carnosa HHB-10118-sp]|uniref:alpha-1,2-Mannosidase n=1 Tax=Phanerochaete carnosa (strain HHB-10118-sp) TaxID=650164 RepID=K5W830_PHACS|nr:glycoside hydrolase family 47 protein [Phanerochaete carnosa HHB-10118-sp]EKM55139.1 glycoside hydrolase family 47 protein [Phanerochaete carnosa HHB-10118-sp]